jgi:hypothetical protein
VASHIRACNANRGSAHTLLRKPRFSPQNLFHRRHLPTRVAPRRKPPPYLYVFVGTRVVLFGEAPIERVDFLRLA